MPRKLLLPFERCLPCFFLSLRVANFSLVPAHPGIVGQRSAKLLREPFSGVFTGEIT